jgi:hypothetical protein
MRADEMTAEQREAALKRYERAEEIITDYEQQHDFKLPEPWKSLIPRLLLQGLGDPELHLIFDAIAQVEFQAGRISE